MTVRNNIQSRRSIARDRRSLLDAFMCVCVRVLVSPTRVGADVWLNLRRAHYFAFDVPRYSATHRNRAGKKRQHKITSATDNEGL